MEKTAVQTLDRALDVIELLSLERDGLGVTEIGSRIALHKSTVHRLLNSLADRGYIEKTESSRYRLGLKFIELASLRLNHLELKTEAAPALRRLAELAGRVAHLAILDDTEAVYIEKVEPVASLRMYSQIGRRIPVHCTALGKSLLSGLEEGDLRTLLGRLPYQRFTASTKTTPAELRLEIDRTRARGWSLDDAEHEDGIRCVAAPVRDYTSKVIAAISVSGPANQGQRAEDLADEVRGTALAISRRMGYAQEER